MSVNFAPTPSVEGRAAEGLAAPKRYFSFQRMLLCALPLLVLLLWVVALSSLATAGGTATAEQPARMSVQIPTAVKSSAVVMLELSIAVTHKPSAGHLGAVIKVRSPGGSAIEVGRVSIAGDGGSYQFNVARALGQMSGGQAPGGPAEVEVSVIDRAGGPPPSGAALSIGHAQIVTR